jgi:D-beta-D-heptose 7-phosphate kinase/D-beta-D-heptose 1-phosphate adenosyltransferase
MSKLVPPSDFVTIAVSGGFDPIHKGHVRMIRAAAEHGHVVVIANSDDWLMRKKGYVFMKWRERAEILQSIKGVIAVYEAKDSDNSVCETLKSIKPSMFANGGDRKSDNVPEVALCKELGIKMLWNVGGEKIQSSSELVVEANKNKRRHNGIKL